MMKLLKLILCGNIGSSNEYNNLKLKLKSLDNLNECFDKKLINLKTIGKSSFFFIEKRSS